MPYLPDEHKVELAKPSTFPDKAGDWNFLFSQAYLAFWNAEGNQRYHTIHKLAKASVFPEEVPEVALVEQRLVSEGVYPNDRMIARALAFTEFYARIGSFYERLARIKNGDLVEYKQAIKQLEQMVADYYAPKEIK